MGPCLARPGTLEFGTLLLPASMEPVDKVLCIVFRCFSVYSSEGTVLRMSVAFEATELFNDFITVRENIPWLSERLAVNNRF